MGQMRLRDLPALTLALLMAGSAFPQEQRGSMEGTVRDESGAAVPGASVEARSPALIGVARSTGDAKGTYRFPALNPGIYEVTAELRGFTPARVGEIVVTLGKNLRVDLTLKLAAKAERETRFASRRTSAPASSPPVPGSSVTL